MNRLKFLSLAAMAFALFSATPAAANQLLNAGFETDAVFGAEPFPGALDWNTFGNANTASADLDPVRTGIGSLQLVGGGGFGVPGAFQTFPANPGETWDLQGYMLTENALPANATFGLLKIVWSDGVSDLPPAAIIFGQADASAFPGIQALPFLNSASTPNTWQFAQARGVAPAGTTEVKFFALFVDENAGTAYFDDLQATLVPAAPALPGDYNQNNVVDAADYNRWRDNLGSGTALPRDGGLGTPIGQAHYNQWKTNFGMTLPPGAGAGSLGASAVPEPTALFLAIMAMLGSLIVQLPTRSAR